MDSFDYEMYLKYFYRDVLNFYRNNSHIYRVVEDDMGGEIHVTDNFNKNDENKYPYISLKFGF